MEISVRMRGDIEIAVPASLGSITTYVLLEQEQWFEKEPAFLEKWLKPGMVAVDIGANLGVYSLPMARLVGPTGRVFAYEPGSEARALLAISKSRNGIDNLSISASAVSDSEREGNLVLGTSSELNALGTNGPGEKVHITSLDAESRAGNWSTVDFVKIDAEGEEERILKGADAFFAGHSPLVMFEIAAGDKVNEQLPMALMERGFGIYRLLQGAPVLVPLKPDEARDPYELNLFAAKPDRTASLINADMLVETIGEWEATDVARAEALTLLHGQVFAEAFAPLIPRDLPIRADYLDALAGFAAWHSGKLALSQRVAALKFAYDTLLEICQTDASLARLSTLARIAWEFGQRRTCVEALALLEKILKSGTGKMIEPFWPANPRFDAVAPGSNPFGWFVVAALEQLEIAHSFSSCYGSSAVNLDWLSSQPFISAEIERRRILHRARTGEQVAVSQRLLAAADDHLNAELWQSRRVPNTV